MVSRNVMVLSMLFISIMLFLGCASSVKLTNDKIFYKGLSKCEGTQVEVSFTYDAQTSTINDFKSIESCIGGKNLGGWELGEIMVGKDGSFSRFSKNGHLIIKGIITPSGEISGEFGKVSYVIYCGQGFDPRYKFDTCDKWTASPVK